VIDDLSEESGSIDISGLKADPKKLDFNMQDLEGLVDEVN